MVRNVVLKPTFPAVAARADRRDKSGAEGTPATWQLAPDCGEPKRGNGLPEVQKFGPVICRFDFVLASTALYRTVHSVRKIKSERAKSRPVRQLCETRASSHARVCV